MEEDIKISEERIKSIKNYDTYRYDWLETDIQLVENLIKGYREKEESEKYLYDAYQDAGKKMFEYTEQLENSIPKSKIVEIYREIEKKTRNLFNSTYIPMNERIYNDNREKYEPMLKGREIAIECLKSLQELMEDK